MAISGYTGQRLGAHTTDATVSTATTITPEAGADWMIIQTYGQAINITFDGTTPTATTGFTLAVGVPYRVDFGQDTTVKIIEVAAGATVQWQCFRTKRETDT